MAVQLLTRTERALDRWECQHVDSRDRSALELAQVKAVVGYVWNMAGLHRPPAVIQVAKGDAGYVPGAMAYVTGDHLTMAIQVPAPKTVLVLHELAHALLDDPLDILELRGSCEREMHGPLWLANYLFLLGKLMGPLYNPFHMRSTLPAEVRGWRIPWHPTVRGKPRVDMV